MRRAAINKAKKRMEEAMHWFTRLDGIMSPEQFEHRWGAFLNAINRAFNALDAGHRDDAKTRTWWSKKKHQWKRDPLLQYLHQARNSDEHGLDMLHKTVPGYFSKNIPAEFDLDGLEHYKLVPVRNDKFNDTFDVPAEHLGEALQPGEVGLPWYAAGRAMGYYNRLIIEAETYVSEPPA